MLDGAHLMGRRIIQKTGGASTRAAPLGAFTLSFALCHDSLRRRCRTTNQSDDGDFDAKHERAAANAANMFSLDSIAPDIVLPYAGALLNREQVMAMILLFTYEQ